MLVPVFSVYCCGGALVEARVGVGTGGAGGGATSSCAGHGQAAAVERMFVPGATTSGRMRRFAAGPGPFTRPRLLKSATSFALSENGKSVATGAAPAGALNAAFA